MKLKTWVVLAVLCGCQASAPAEDPAPAVTGAAVRVEASRGRTSFLFEARTTLQDGSRFQLHLAYVRRWKIPPGLVEPGQPDYDEELVELDKEDVRSEKGAILAELGVSDEAPWPGRYRVVVTWPDAESPADDGLARVQADVEAGDAKELPALRARLDREVYEDMARIGQVLDGVKKRWKALGDGADGTWKEFRSQADRKIDGVKARNGRRRKAELYWMETRGRQRIDWTLQKLCPLLDKAGLHIARPAGERPPAEDMDLALADLEEDYQHYLDFLGIGRIVDAPAVDAALAAIGDLAGEVKAWKGRAGAEGPAWQEASTDLSVRLMETSMRLSAELPEAYFTRAESVQRSVLRMFDHVRDIANGRKPAAEWDELAGKLDAAVKDLRDSIPRVKDE